MTSPLCHRVPSVLAALLLGCSLAQGQPRYTLTDLGPPGDGHTFSSGIAVNTAGQVLVTELGRQTAYLYTPGQGLADLADSVPGPRQPGRTVQVTVSGLNDAGQVIGTWRRRTAALPRDSSGAVAGRTR